MTKPKIKPKAATRSTARKTSKPKSRARSARAPSKPATGPHTKHARIHCDVANFGWRDDCVSRRRSSIRCAAFLPVWFARSSDSTLFQSKRTRVGSIVSGMVRLRLQPRTRPNRRPDAMQKLRNGRKSKQPGRLAAIPPTISCAFISPLFFRFLAPDSPHGLTGVGYVEVIGELIATCR